MATEKTTGSSSDIVRTRLLSLDALRGFDMFWIVGGAALVHALTKRLPSEWMTTFDMQFRHVPWEGLHFYDLIFPLFMFISGATIPLAVLAKLEGGAPLKKIILKTAGRMITLVILGTIYNGTLRDGFGHARYSSILGQIGIAYFFATLITVYTKSVRIRLYWLIGLLSVYAAIQLLVPVPGHGAGVLTKEGCINVYIDTNYLPGRMGQVTYDAVGILNIFSAIAITLMGTFAGTILRMGNLSGMRKTGLLAAIGAGITILALVLNPLYPIIKNCWTSTYNLIGGGISFLLVALFYLIIDVWGWKKWSFFFQVIGLNSIFIYFLNNMINVAYTSQFFFGWLTVSVSEESAKVIITAGGILLTWLLLYFMYRKKIFFKV